MLNLPVKLQEIKESNAVFLIELYEIYLPTMTLRYASCDTDITFAGNVYTAAPIQRDAVKSTADSKVDNTKLTVSDFDSSFTLALLTGYNFLGCRCVIFQVPYPDALADASLVYPVFWGDLDSPVLTTKTATFEVDVVAPTTYLENARTMQLPCNSQFADGESCMAAIDLRNGTVQGGSTVYDVYIQYSTTENHWQFGIITVGYETRLIVSSEGAKVTVDYPFSMVPTGDYTIQCGCDKSHDTCGLHGQQENYSGMLGIPFEYSVKS